ncbi:MAG: hypothetical protein NTY66_01515 [Candidatus Vogelbacteria bacterium]|nr:hypothetical protein [Candidatus Vogelbacteria bacterium]
MLFAVFEGAESSAGPPNRRPDYPNKEDAMRSIWFVLVLAIVILLAGLETARASPRWADSAYYGKLIPAPFISTPAPSQDISQTLIIRLIALPESARLALSKTPAIVGGSAEVIRGSRELPAQIVLPSARSGPQSAATVSKDYPFWYTPAIIASATSSAKRNARDTGDR